MCTSPTTGVTGDARDGNVGGLVHTARRTA